MFSFPVSISFKDKNLIKSVKYVLCTWEIGHKIELDEAVWEC